MWTKCLVPKLYAHHLSVIFMIQAPRGYPWSEHLKGAPLRLAPSLLANIGLGLKASPGTNALAYFAETSVAKKKKSLLTSNPRSKTTGRSGRSGRTTSGPAAAFWREKTQSTFSAGAKTRGEWRGSTSTLKVGTWVRIQRPRWIWSTPVVSWSTKAWDQCHITFFGWNLY